MMDRRGDWADHERYVHRRVWRCSEHSEKEYSVEEYVNHVKREHSQYVSELTSPEVLEASVSTTTVHDRACPLCFLELATAKELEAHILYHLETIALLALPRATGMELEGQRDDFGSEKLNAEDDSRFDDADLSQWGEGDNEIIDEMPRAATQLSLSVASFRAHSRQPEPDDLVGDWFGRYEPAEQPVIESEEIIEGYWQIPSRPRRMAVSLEKPESQETSEKDAKMPGAFPELPPISGYDPLTPPLPQTPVVSTARQTLVSAPAQQASMNAITEEVEDSRSIYSLGGRSTRSETYTGARSTTYEDYWDPPDSPVERGYSSSSQQRPSITGRSLSSSSRARRREEQPYDIYQPNAGGWPRWSIHGQNVEEAMRRGHRP
jgi:hypothetical protein